MSWPRDRSMQHLEVDVGGRRRRIAVARAGEGFAVTVDGRAVHVDVARVDAHTLSLVVDTVCPADAAAPADAPPAGRPSLSRPAFEITIAPDPATAQLTVRVGTMPVVVSVNGRRRGRRDDAGGGGSGPQRVSAPMPGKVVRVLVRAGDAVRARQPLVVVEAMKMENELRAGRAGKVAEIHAREGQTVDAGALLVVVQ